MADTPSSDKPQMTDAERLKFERAITGNGLVLDAALDLERGADFLSRLQAQPYLLPAASPANQQRLGKAIAGVLKRLHAMGVDPVAIMGEMK